MYFSHNFTLLNGILSSTIGCHVQLPQTKAFYEQRHEQVCNSFNIKRKMRIYINKYNHKHDTFFSVILWMSLLFIDFCYIGNNMRVHNNYTGIDESHAENSISCRYYMSLHIMGENMLVDTTLEKWIERPRH